MSLGGFVSTVFCYGHLPDETQQLADLAQLGERQTEVNFGL